MSEDVSQITEASARGSFFLVTGQLTAFLLDAITVFILARLLGPEVYGLYILVLVFPNLMLEMVDLGINHGIIRFSASLRTQGQSQKIAKLLRDGFLFKIVIGLVMFGICFVLSDYLATYFLHRPEIGVYIRLSSVLIIARVFTTTSFAAFIGLDHMHYNALSTIVNSFLKAFVSIPLVILGFSIIGAIIGFVVGILVSGVLSSVLLYFRLYRPLKHTHSDKEPEPTAESNWKFSLKTLISYGSPLYISALLSVIIPQLQSIILALFTLNYDIGNFRASLNFIIFLSAVIVPIATSLFPAFSKFDCNSEKVRTFFGLSVKYASLIMIPAAFLLIILSREIIYIIYGASFSSAPLYLSLHATIFLLVGLGYEIQKSLFSGLGEPSGTLKIVMIEFMFFTPLAFYLTNVLGVTGLIISILVSNVMATGYGAYRARSRHKVSFNYKSLIRIYLVALASVGPVLLFENLLTLPPLLKVFGASAIYMISYLTVVPFAHVITKQELNNVEQIIKKIGPVRPIASLILKYEYALFRN